MSPIRKETIRVEKLIKGRFTERTGKDGEIISFTRKITSQEPVILAEGDEETPGLYQYERGVWPRNENKIKAPGKMLDIYVDPKTGERKTDLPHGIWKRIG